ncbi:MAG: very short patch repair endonuclease [Verrucomicrobia bacterium]|nr:very short patch repair endonuclease [Verrucomicrobiota bacterium]
MKSISNAVDDVIQVTKARSQNMRAIRSKDTAPELRVRSWLHKSGFRFRLHQRNLPGTPDLVLSKHKVAIQVRGCFWHSHKCRKGKMPLTRREYWEPKLKRNRERDESNDKVLKGLGYRLYVVWECEIKNPSQLASRMQSVCTEIASSS